MTHAVLLHTHLLLRGELQDSVFRSVLAIGAVVYYLISTV